MKWVVLAVGLEFPALVALADVANRDASAFEGGAEDRRSWAQWLLVSLLLCPILVGYGILLGYYWSVIKLTGPMLPKTQGIRDRD